MFFWQLYGKESDVALELGFLAFNIKNKFCDVLDIFIFFLRKYEEKKDHNMLFFMLDPCFKNLHEVSSFTGLVQSKAIFQEYDRQTLYPM
jgi:hypothetical protein